MQLQFLHEIVDDFHYSRQQHSVHKQDLHWTYLCDCCGFFICQTIHDFHHVMPDSNIQSISKTYIGHTRVTVVVSSSARLSTIFVMPDSNIQSISKTYIGHTRVTVVVSSSARPSMISVMSDTVWLELKWMRARGITRSNRRFRDSCSSWKPGWKQGWDQDEIRMTQCSVISHSTEVVSVNERGMHHSEMKGRGNVSLCKNEVMKSCGITPGTVIVCHYTW